MPDPNPCPSWAVDVRQAAPATRADTNRSKATATTKRDYYEVLGVPRNADEKTIKDAFRKLPMQYRPDRNKEPGAEERFKEIAEAYAVLSDPRKRADYDVGGFASVAGRSSEPAVKGGKKRTGRSAVFRVS